IDADGMASPVTASPTCDTLAQMHFRIAGGTRGARAAFMLEAPDGAILLRSGTFAEREACLDAVRAAVHHLADADRLDVVPEGDGVVVVIEGDAGVLGRSPRLSTESEGRALRDRILAEAAMQDEFEVLVLEDDAAVAAAPRPQREKPRGVTALYDFSRSSA